MNRLMKTRLLKVLAMGVLLSVSTVTLAGQGNGKGYSQGHSKGHYDQRYAGHDGGNAYNRHAGKHQRGRYYAPPKHHGKQHRHGGRYCYVNHYPVYATRYATPVYVPRPAPVVVYPPRIGLYFGGRIDF